MRSCDSAYFWPRFAHHCCWRLHRSRHLRSHLLSRLLSRLPFEIDYLYFFIKKTNCIFNFYNSSELNYWKNLIFRSIPKTSKQFDKWEHADPNEKFRNYSETSTIKGEGIEHYDETSYKRSQLTIDNQIKRIEEAQNLAKSLKQQFDEREEARIKRSTTSTIQLFIINNCYIILYINYL